MSLPGAPDRSDVVLADLRLSSGVNWQPNASINHVGRKRKSCRWKENPIVWFWSMCKCVFLCILYPGSTIMTYNNYYCLSLQAVVLYYITFIISPVSVLDKCRQIGIKLVMVSASIHLSFAQVGKYSLQLQHWTIKSQAKEQMQFVCHSWTGFIMLISTVPQWLTFFY